MFSLHNLSEENMLYLKITLKNSISMFLLEGMSLDMPYPQIHSMTTTPT